ncbi:CBS domain-containing protein [Ancylobacter sp. Lp-2]|uniref:CBS domain-containing protein n=1 Tax=Ancylobacter sp. Lp-2 TaxID=2881339 RepID=UPI001E41C558|nr:CBS domain-containing protein [Ancylobacter sp. Lp-2]MCB4769612.1 CBS domain-containing protein [Ancylobacter sp. Lp-2]
MRVKDVMTTTIISVSPEHGVKKATKLMLDHSVSGLPVVDDDGRIVGIITEGDLIRRTELVSNSLAVSEETENSADEIAGAYLKRTSWRVGDVMTGDVITVSEDTSLMDVARLMHERSIKRIPVTREDKVIGIVSRIDLLHVILMTKADQTATGDEAIQRSIVHRLRENTGLDDLNLTVTVLDGTVHLWGNIDTAERRRAARVVVEGVQGVRGIVEHFTAP